MHKEIRNITIFGPGMMGSGIGIQFAQKGCNVILRARAQFHPDHLRHGRRGKGCGHDL